MKSIKEVLNLPIQRRAYKVDVVGDNKPIYFKSLRKAIRAFYEEEKVNSKYQTIYSALFTEKHGFWFGDNIRISVVYIEDAFSGKELN